MLQVAIPSPTGFRKVYDPQAALPAVEGSSISPFLEPCVQVVNEWQQVVELPRVCLVRRTEWEVKIVPPSLVEESGFQQYMVSAVARLAVWNDTMVQTPILRFFLRRVRQGRQLPARGVVPRCGKLS